MSISKSSTGVSTQSQASLAQNSSVAMNGQGAPQGMPPGKGGPSQGMPPGQGTPLMMQQVEQLSQTRVLLLMK